MPDMATPDMTTPCVGRGPTYADMATPPCL